MRTKSIGVVVARLETPYLHTGHQYLFDYALNQNDTLCVVLGDHGGVPHDRYLLDVATRTSMIKSAYPHAVVLPLKDAGSDTAWSHLLDELVIRTFPNDRITIYGSRESFLEQYDGTLTAEMIAPVSCPSATDIRNNECSAVRDHVEFRRGAIYAAMTRLPIVYGTVDIAPYRDNDGVTEILMGIKYSDGGKVRFIGGFLDPKDVSHRAAAHRELWEEVGMIEVTTPVYVDSFKINDRRYAGSKDSVLTTLFITQFLWGGPKAQDDLDDVAWIPVTELLSKVAELHIPLAQAIVQQFEKK